MMMMMGIKQVLLFFIILKSAFLIVTTQKVDPWEVRCHVCKAVIREMEIKIATINPTKKEEVGSYRIDSDGNVGKKTVQYAKSEIFLTELMENICSKMSDYAKAIDKKTGRFVLLKLLIDGKMNPDMPNVHLVQDGDLNKSLEHYCLEILEDQDEAFLEAFMKEKYDDNSDIRICSEIGKYCKDAPIQEEYTLEDDKQYNDEL